MVKIISEVCVAIAVMIKKFGGNLQILDKFLQAHAHKYLNFHYLEEEKKLFGYKGLKCQLLSVDLSKKFTI